MSNAAWKPTVSYDDKQALYGKSATEIVDAVKNQSTTTESSNENDAGSENN